MKFTRIWGRGLRLAVLLALILGTLTLSALAVEWSISDGTLTVTGEDYVPDRFAEEELAGQIGEIRRIVLSEGITGIGYEAFLGCTSLTEVLLPNTLEFIDSSCFEECVGLTRIEIPASVTDIQDSIFYCDDGSSLNTIIFHGTPSYIGDYAFEGVVFARAFYYEDTGWDESNMLEYNGTISWQPILTSGTWSLTEEDDVHWSYADGTLTISGQGMMDGCVPTSPWAFYADEIESVIIEPGVTSIGLQAFAGFSNLTEVTIADTVTGIASAAFMNCTGLKTLKLPDYLESLSEYTFSNSGIETIQLPENLVSIKMGCFENCSALTEITFPASLETIDSNSFDGCTALRTITFLGDAVTLVPYGDEATRFGENVTATVSIPEDNTTWTDDVIATYGPGLTWPTEATSGTCGENATWVLAGNTLTISGTGAMTDYPDNNSNPWIEYSDSITRIVIEEGITGIGDNAFSYLNSLAQVSLPESLRYIGHYAFYYCGNLTEISLPTNLATIYDNAFRSTGLSAIVIPDSVTSLGEAVFYGCSNLTSCTLPNNLESIPFHAFHSCTKLESIHIPASVNSIGYGAFYDCTALKDVYIDDLEKWLSTYSSSGFSVGYTLHLNGEPVTDLVIPESILEIPGFSFYNCTSIQSLTAPKVQTIGEYAFYGCSALDSVLFSDALTWLNDSSFQNCKSLKTVQLPVSVENIGFEVFSHSGLTELYFYGPAPTLADNFLDRLENLKICYPEGDSTWTDVANKPYGAIDPEWIPHTVLPPVCPHENIVIDAAVPATCTEEGKTEGSHCGDCGEVLTPQETVPALGHTPGELTGKLDPTCTEDGYTGDIYCTVCETLITEGKAIAATGHTPITVNVIKATCVSQGYTGDEVCQNCNDYEVKYGEKLPMSDHSWSEPIRVLPTFTHSGFMQETCSVCKQIRETVLPKLEQENPFVDVKEDAWYHDSVLWAARNDITTGTDATHFSPDAVCTRGQVVTLLWRAMTDQLKSNGINPFTDVKKDSDYFYDAVLWAEKNHITEGTSATTFSPALSCTRAQVVTFLWRASGCPAPASRSAFSDVPDGTWYSDAVLWAKATGIADGIGNGLFGPNAECTRAHIVTFLCRWMAPSESAIP